MEHEEVGTTRMPSTNPLRVSTHVLASWQPESGDQSTTTLSEAPPDACVLVSSMSPVSRLQGAANVGCCQCLTMDISHITRAHEQVL